MTGSTISTSRTICSTVGIPARPSGRMGEAPAAIDSTGPPTDLTLRSRCLTRRCGRDGTGAWRACLWLWPDGGLPMRRNISGSRPRPSPPPGGPPSNRQCPLQDDYLRLWDWSWRHLVDHENGAWFRIVSREGAWVEPYKSPAGKVDYHTMGACWDVLSVMRGGTDG